MFESMDEIQEIRYHFRRIQHFAEPTVEPTPTPKPTVEPTASAPGVVKPTVYVPQGWSVSEDVPYPTIGGEDSDTSWGRITLVDATDGDLVEIYYGDVPSDLVGQADNAVALSNKASEYAGIEPEEVWVITAAGQRIGLYEACNPALDTCENWMVLVKGDTCAHTYAKWNAAGLTKYRHDDPAVAQGRQQVLEILLKSFRLLD